MKFLPVHFVVWLITLVLFPVPVTTLPRSFQVEVLECIKPVPLSPRSDMVLSERVLAYLAQAEGKEIDLWLRDDIRIAWITTLEARTRQSSAARLCELTFSVCTPIKFGRASWPAAA